MNRDEDTRAEYIKEFTRGLLQIQKNMPYIFYNVSGIDKLREFQPKTGFRLKDTKITIDCYEGIDMKIKTLLELYRKAAYDEVWQRWILPDIYRYFKLIIYVYDKRILRNPLGEYSLDQENFPIMAFECGPCEIDLMSTLKDTYSTNYKEIT